MAPQRHQKSPFYPGGGDSVVNPEAFQEVIGQPWTSSPGVRVEVGGRQDLTGSQRCPFTSSPWVQRWGQDGGGGGENSPFPLPLKWESEALFFV